jgi:hypothetical protein
MGLGGAGDWGGARMNLRHSREEILTAGWVSRADPLTQIQGDGFASKSRWLPTRYIHQYIYRFG